MKNISPIALAVCLSFGLVACGSGGGNGEGKASNITQQDTFTLNTPTPQEQTELNALEEDDQPDSKIDQATIKAIPENKKFTGFKSPYASYVGIITSKQANQEDVKYVIEHNKDKGLTTNYEAVTDANYVGTLTITDLNRKNPNGVLITKSMPVKFRVENKSISGSADIDSENHLTFDKTDIVKYKKGIGFTGEVSITSNTDTENEKGSYKGIFVGSKPEGLVGHFELPSAKGAFAAENRGNEEPQP